MTLSWKEVHEEIESSGIGNALALIDADKVPEELQALWRAADDALKDVERIVAENID